MLVVLMNRKRDGLKNDLCDGQKVTSMCHLLIGAEVVAMGTDDP